ncbi:MAG: DinB family protein [Bacteroidetes bacterium]|nr:DinB family protein [Bacteroidota bacterium]
MLQKPPTSEYSSFFQRYMDKIPDGDLLKLLRTNLDATVSLVKDLPESKLAFRYAEGKWSIKEVLIHHADGERIFSYRALCIARGDQTPLPGFDENEYAPQSFADLRSIGSILQEMKSIRESTIELFSNFDPSVWTRMGTVSNAPISVRAIAYIIAGHELHHQSVIREKYLS